MNLPQEPHLPCPDLKLRLYSSVLWILTCVGCDGCGDGTQHVPGLSFQWWMYLKIHEQDSSTNNHFKLHNLVAVFSENARLATENSCYCHQPVFVKWRSCFSSMVRKWWELCQITIISPLLLIPYHGQLPITVTNVTPSTYRGKGLTAQEKS